jgi:predicted 3-demethylubiquinone-9 3-methyltransferase (glyoxalase superfamily)
MTHTIYPCLWFDGQAQAAAEFYCSVFNKSKIISQNPIVTVFELNNTRFMALNGGPQYKFSPANSYVITCDTQDEIDYYWVKLGEEGEYGMCGWLDDKFGVSWQIVPSILSELMTNPTTAPKVTQAFMRVTKFNIEELLSAAK